MLWPLITDTQTNLFILLNFKCWAYVLENDGSMGLNNILAELLGLGAWELATPLQLQTGIYSITFTIGLICQDKHTSVIVNLLDWWIASWTVLSTAKSILCSPMLHLWFFWKIHAKHRQNYCTSEVKGSAFDIKAAFEWVMHQGVWINEDNAKKCKIVHNPQSYRTINLVLIPLVGQ